MRIRDSWRRTIAALDWYGRLLFVLGLGVGGTVALLVTGFVALVAEFPTWILVLLCATLLLVFVPLTLFVADAIRGLIRQRRAHRKLGPQEFAQQLNHLVFEL